MATISYHCSNKNRLDTGTKKNIGFVIFCIAGLALNFFAYYPGFLSPDSLDQYQQAIGHNYHDWHPPAMALLWTVFNFIHKGTSSMLLMQLLCLWTSVFLLCRLNRHVWWKISIVLFAFAPFVQNFCGYLVKDSQMALCWLVSFSIMAAPLLQQRRISTLEATTSALLLAYGEWVRPNALPGAIPLCLLWAWLFLLRTEKPKALKVIIAGACLCTAIVAGQWIISNVIAKPAKSYPENKLFLHDLTGIYVRTGENPFPPIVFANPDFDTSYLRTHYHPATFDGIWWNNDNLTILPAPDEQITHDLFRAWKSAVTRHPIIYLQQRFEGFLYYLRVKNRREEFHYYFPWVHPNELGVVHHENMLTRMLQKPIKWQKDTFYMKPWFWFFLNVLLLFLSRAIRRRATRQLYNTLVWSAFLYQATSFLIFQTDTDFRYFYWNCIACFLAVAFLLNDRLTKADQAN